MESTLHPVGPDLVSYVVDVVCGDGRLDLAVVFRPVPGEDPVSSAKGRLQWFMMFFVGMGQILEVGSNIAHAAVYPADTLFLVSEMPNEVFWCGPSAADEVVIRQARHLPYAMRWDWEPSDELVVNEVTLEAGEA